MGVLSQNYVIYLAKETITVVLLVGGPILLAALVTGLTVGIFQALTQIQEQTLTFIPKLVAVAVVMVVLGPWMMRVLMAFTTNLFNSLPGLSNF